MGDQPQPIIPRAKMLLPSPVLRTLSGRLRNSGRPLVVGLASSSPRRALIAHPSMSPKREAEGLSQCALHDRLRQA
jgi:hypothetical protein